MFDSSHGCQKSRRFQCMLTFSFNVKKSVVRALRVPSLQPEVPDRRLMSANKLSQSRLIIHFTVAADKLCCQ